MAIREEFYYDSADNETKIHAVKWIPDIEVVAILQIAHGMLEHIDRYDYFAKYAASMGILVAGNDHLGHGYSLRTEEERGFFSEHDGNKVLIEDMGNLKEILKKEYKVPYFMLGHSMGSFLVRQYISMHDDVDGALIIGTGCKPYILVKSGLILTKLMAAFKGWRYRSRFIDKLTIGGNNKFFEPVRTKVDWLSRDEETVDSYINDKRINFTFTLNAFYNMFKGMLYLYQEKYLNNIPKDLSIFILSGEDDPVGAFGKDITKLQATYINLGIKDVSYILYKNDRHEILNELDKENVYDDIINWIYDKVENNKK